MRVIVESLLRSLGPLGDVMILFGVMFLCFGILSLDIFRGQCALCCLAADYSSRHKLSCWPRATIMPQPQCFPLSPRQA